MGGGCRNNVTHKHDFKIFQKKNYYVYLDVLFTLIKLFLDRFTSTIKK